MATFILFWNPAISSFKLTDYQDFLSQRPEIYDLNWSIWEHESANCGDKYYMVRCKNKPVKGKVNKWGKQVWEPCIDDTTGICMSGTIKSQPWEGDDWSGKGRETYYVDLWIDHMADPDSSIIVPTSELIDVIPEFDWKGGHSGRILEDSLAEKLETLFASNLEAKRNSIWTPQFRVMVD